MRFSSFSLPLLYLTFTASSVYSHTHSLTHIHTHTVARTHTHTHTQWGPPFSLSVSHTHTDQKRKTPTGLILFPGMKNQSVFIFFFINNSVSQFGSQRRQLGWCPNSRQSQFLGIFFVFFNSYIVLNKLFILHSMYLSL